MIDRTHYNYNKIPPLSYNFFMAFFDGVEEKDGE